MVHETAALPWLQPMNIPHEPLAAFCGLDETLFEGATLAVSYCDPQAGEREHTLGKDEMREKLDWLAGLVVTCKQNALPPAGAYLRIHAVFSAGRTACGFRLLP